MLINRHCFLVDKIKMVRIKTVIDLIHVLECVSLEFNSIDSELKGTVVPEYWGSLDFHISSDNSHPQAVPT